MNQKSETVEEHVLTTIFVEMNPVDMQFWLCKFITETRRADGKCYSPNTLHQLICGLLRALRE